MASTRTRLTISYLVVLTATLIAFAVAVYVARGAEADHDVFEQSAALGDDVLATIRNATFSGKRLSPQELPARGHLRNEVGSDLGRGGTHGCRVDHDRAEQPIRYRGTSWCSIRRKLSTSTAAIFRATIRTRCSRACCGERRRGAA
jgi:hypothetical protein